MLLVRLVAMPLIFLEVVRIGLEEVFVEVVPNHLLVVDDPI